MIVRAHVSLFGLLAIPGSGTNRYPASVATYSRRGHLEAPDGRVVYVRMVDSAESSLSSLLTDTSGSALASSSNASFPSSAGWKVVEAGSVEGVFAFEVAVGSAQSAAQGRLDVGYRSESESMQASQSFAISGSASVDLSPVTDAIGAWGDIEDDETVFGAIAGVAEDVAGISLASVEALIGTPSSTLAGDIAAIKAVVGNLGDTGKTLAELLDPLLLAYGTVTTGGSTSIVTCSAFIGKDLQLELLVFLDVSTGHKVSRTIANFNSGTGAMTVSTLAAATAVGDKCWVYPRAQTAP